MLWCPTKCQGGQCCHGEHNRKYQQQRGSTIPPTACGALTGRLLPSREMPRRPLGPSPFCCPSSAEDHLLLTGLPKSGRFSWSSSPSSTELPLSPPTRGWTNMDDDLKEFFNE